MPEVPTALWTYRARLERVVDGDTVDLYIDAGFRSYRSERLRLLGVNCPEVHGTSKAAGLASTAYTANWLQQGVALDQWPLVVQTHRSDAFGRYLATIWRVVDGTCLNEALLEAGMAVAFMVGEEAP